VLMVTHLLGYFFLRSYKMEYKLLKSSLTNETSSVLRLLDNASIPFDPDNTDYQAYLKWLEAGNTPEPADE
jgi:hypothetical protein